MELVRFGFLHFAQNSGCVEFIPRLISLNAKKGLIGSANMATLGGTDFTSQGWGIVLQLNRESRGMTVFRNLQSTSLLINPDVHCLTASASELFIKLKNDVTNSSVTHSSPQVRAFANTRQKQMGKKPVSIYE